MTSLAQTSPYSKIASFKLKAEKEITETTLKDKMHSAKFDLLKQYLEKENITIPKDITDTKELLNYIKKNLSKEKYEYVLAKKDELDQDIEEMFEELKAGSSSAFSRKIQEIVKAIKPIGLAVATPLAINTAFTLFLPTSLKIFAGAAILAHNGYKIIKTNKKRKIANKEYELSKIIRELEIKKNDKGEILDTRFSEGIQTRIREFLKEKNIVFKDTGYIALSKAIYSLKFEDKKALCNILNNELGNTIDIEARLKQYDKGFFKRNFGTVSTTIGYGLDLANNINDIPLLRNAVSTILTAAGVSIATQNLQNGIIAAGVKTSAEAISSFFNVGETVVESINSTINTVGFAGIFAAVGVVGSVGMATYNYLKGKKEREQIKKELDKIKKIDNKLYQTENDAEINEIKRLAQEEPNLADAMVVSLTCEFMLKKNIKIPNTITNAKELVEYIKTLGKKDQKEIMNFYNDMTYYNKHHHSAFVKKSLEVCEAVGKAAVYGLAGLSLIDLFTKGNFLEDLKTTKTETEAVQAITVDEPVDYDYGFSDTINDVPVDSPHILDNDPIIQNLPIEQIEQMPNNELYYHLRHLTAGHGFDPEFMRNAITSNTGAQDYQNKITETFNNMFGSLSENRRNDFINYFNELNRGEIKFFPKAGEKGISANHITSHEEIGELLKDFIGVKTKQATTADKAGNIATTAAATAVAVNELTRHSVTKTGNDAKGKQFTREQIEDKINRDLENLPVNIEEKISFKR